MLLEVIDRGSGFDPQVQDWKSSHFGLFEVRERLHALGGHMALSSVPGSGTHVRLNIPSRRHAPSRPGEEGAPQSHGAEASARRIRLMLVDDHEMVREGLKGLIELRPEFEVIGEAEDGQAALELAGELKPDLIIMDINMPKMDGIEATEKIKQAYPEIKVIGLSYYNDEQRITMMRQAGADDYLSKGGSSDELYQVMRRVAM